MKANNVKGITITAFIFLTLALNILLLYTAYSHFTIYEGARKMDVTINIETEITESYSQIEVHMVLINPSKASFRIFSIFSDLYLNQTYLGRKVLSYDDKPIQIESNSNKSFIITYGVAEALRTQGARWTIRLYLALYSVSLPTYVPLRFTRVL